MYASRERIASADTSADGADSNVIITIISTREPTALAEARMTRIEDALAMPRPSCCRNEPKDFRRDYQLTPVDI
jgi:hypothetical protein